ncbi:MAG: redoxin domain-containing protein [Candidatus Marinimicrobia bacterium]|nr:redoxin domain-containing protein [Candidatus Neomarinimicrobiota bacterium]MCF7850423.1 redoxin domain-containing protein [Candidatus Neomarinimicrobiota bacterium]MCF7905260.1 redoxin domain-containing protein [Candidatus Neomarinimicrobiota bacterium]
MNRILITTLILVASMGNAKAMDLTGKPAPDFTLKDEEGIAHTLSDYLGQDVVVYFYPKDDTPG